MLTGSGADEDIYKCLRAAVQSYLWKSMSRDELLKAIRVVHGGGRLIPAPIAKVFSERPAQSDLTEREVQVLELIVNGKSNKRIAAALQIAEGSCLSRVFRPSAAFPDQLLTSFSFGFRNLRWDGNTRCVDSRNGQQAP